MFRSLLFPFLFFLASCGTQHYGTYESCGADEFVRDSYQIRKGKFSILEMEGCDYGWLEPHLLEEYQDTIQEGDVLGIRVYYPERDDLARNVNELGRSVGYPVLEGEVFLPHLGAVKVEGLTLQEARELLSERFSEEFLGAQVFISYSKRIWKKVELIGLSSVPEVPVDGKMRLYDVLAKARIPNDANLFRSYVLRGDCALTVDLYKLLRCGDMSQNIVMRGGDKIFIASKEESTVSVAGEVLSPRLVPVPYGFLSVRDALASAGGIDRITGDTRVIQVIRGNFACPKIYTLNEKQIFHLPNDSMLLIPGDTVYVAAKPITEWNRLISQLLPTTQGTDAAFKALDRLGLR